MPDLRATLRALPVFAGDLPGFDPSATPEAPTDLFREWLAAAVVGGVLEPHAMVVATVDGDGRPSSRVLICKDITDDDGGSWAFATDMRSRKGAELEGALARGGSPWAAATFSWPAQGRQVRLRGPVRRASPEASAADFLARSADSRAAALAARPGERLGGLAELAAALDEARGRVERDPGAVLESWVVYVIVPDEVEFFAGSPDRAHVRLVYSRGEAGWTHGLVWP